MKKRGLWMPLLSIALVGCSLGGDITPPAQIDSGLTPIAYDPGQQTDAGVQATHPPEAQGQARLSSKGSVIGGIENDTIGASVPGGLEVNLVASDEQAFVFSTTTSADENGRFAFDDIDIVPGRFYLNYVDYKEVRYVSDARPFPEGDDVLDLSLQIFETTDDDSGLRVRRLHLIFELSAEDQIDVTQVWIIDGLEDRTVIEGDGAGVVDIRLPAGFSNLGINDSISPEGRYLLSDTGFIDRAPVQPGKPVELVFAFTLPYESGLDYSQLLMYPVNAVVVMLVSEELSVQVDGLEDLGLREMAGFSLRSYSMGTLQSGDTLVVRLGSKAALLRGDNALIVYVSVAIFLIVAALYVLLRFARIRRLDREVESIPRNLREDYQALIKVIASLDDAFEAGELAEDAYQRERAKLKKQALYILRGDDD